MNEVFFDVNGYTAKAEVVLVPDRNMFSESAFVLSFVEPSESKKKEHRLCQLDVVALQDIFKKTFGSEIDKNKALELLDRMNNIGDKMVLDNPFFLAA